jgi:hypothetical protein
MMKTRVLENVAMSVTFFAMTVICGGCNDKPVAVGGGGGGHPLSSGKGRKCPPNSSSENYPIEVKASPDIFVEPANQAVVVCQNDSVSWFTKSSSAVITVTFTDPFANDLFGQPGFPSHAGAPTPTGTVQSQTGHEGRVYKYTIVVKDGAQTFTKDPHVIPMGGGG